MNETTAIAALNALLGDIDMMELDSADGLRMHRPAAVIMNCTGPNKNCRAHHRAGRHIHVRPASSDNLGLLSLPAYHYATLDDAVAAITDAWNNAITVTTASARDAGYRRGVPMWISRDIDLDA